MAVAPSLRRVREQCGFTLIELLAAILILGTGMLALAATFDFSRDLTHVSELNTSAGDRAQREIERIRALPYDQVAHPTGGIAPVSSNAADPTSRIAGSSFAWDRRNPTASEALVTSSGGSVSMKQEIAKGAGDRFGYTIWRFVTSTADPQCAALLTLCPASGNYKRVTVVVRPRGLRDKFRTTWVSTVVIDPTATTGSTLNPAVTTCLDVTGQSIVNCVSTLAGTVQTLFLTATSAGSANDRTAAPTVGTALHNTVAPILASSCSLLGVGCPIPDLLDPDPVDVVEAPPSPVSYATNVTPALSGRPLYRDVACNQAPSQAVEADNRKGGFWASAPLTQETTYNGKGGMSIFSRTLSGQPRQVTLCIIVYSVPNSLLNLIAAAPTELGRTSYSMTAWPGKYTPISFPFQYRTSNVTVAAGKRIGVRIWVANTSADDIGVMYDHQSYPTRVELRQPGA